MHAALALYDLEGEFVGYVIANTAANGNITLESTNVWTYEDSEDLTAQVNRLNQAVDLRAYWPHAADPEVQALINDESWEPVDRIPTEVPDEDKSVMIYHDPPTDIYGTWKDDYYCFSCETRHGGECEKPTPAPDEFVGRRHVDQEASIIVTKTVLVPSPADTMRRAKLAMETVARRRAGA